MTLLSENLLIVLLRFQSTEHSIIHNIWIITIRLLNNMLQFSFFLFLFFSILVQNGRTYDMNKTQREILLKLARIVCSVITINECIELVLLQNFLWLFSDSAAFPCIRCCKFLMFCQNFFYNCGWQYLVLKVRNNGLIWILNTH